MKSNFIFFLVSVSILVFSLSDGRSFRVDDIPNGGIARCENCHVSPSGGGSRNSFGMQVGNGFLDVSGHVVWDASLASLDSDGDGFTNGEELQDPDGTWTSGTAGDPNLVTNPGDPSSFPNATSVQFYSGLPREYQLMQNYPNPFNPSTAISINLPENANVKLKIYDVTGQEVASLVNEFLSAGNYEFNFDGSSLNSGTYFYRMEANGLLKDFSEVKKMVLIK